MKLWILLFPLCLAAATPPDQIRALLDRQVDDWNRGDVRAFMKAYEDSQATTYIGTAVVKGYQRVLNRYLERYPTRQNMGALTFSDIEVRMLGADHALVLGRFHLTRPPAAGGEAQGIFTLVLRRTAQGWKIILDHTSS